MCIYEVRYEAVGAGKYPWVAGWGPSDDMPFIDRLPVWVKKMHGDAWRVSKAAPGLHFEPGGRMWSDVVGSGGGHSPGFFLSQKVLDDIISHSVPILHANRMPIAEYPSRMDASTAPVYYVVEANAGISCDYERSGYRLDDFGKYIRIDKSITDRIYSLDSWDGSDLFAPRGGDGTVNHTILFCSERFKRIADQGKWSNVRFAPVKCH